MQKLPQTPRVSIVIPLQGDEPRFEDTLLSVLENRPEGCQVIVVHNGTYTDPFELDDEVTFATGRSSKLVDLIRDGFSSVEAPLVQVITCGMRATAGWIDELEDRFRDPDVGATIAKLVDASGNPIGSAGWTDVAGRHCQPLVGGKSRPRTRSVKGFFLQGFAIRRELLGGLLEAVAPAMIDPVAVAYAFGCLVTRSGWRIESADEYGLEIDADAIPEDRSDVDRGICLSAIRHVVMPAAEKPGFGVMLQAALMGTSTLAEMFGMLRYRGDVPAMRRSIDPECVPGVDEASQILRLPSQGVVARRAAA